MALRTDYTDAVWSGNKKYKMIYNTDGTVSFEDVTEYTSKENSFFGAKDANEINDTLNNYKSLTDQNTSDIAVINEHISGGDLDATTWGGLTQDTDTVHTSSATWRMCRNGTKVEHILPPAIASLATGYVSLTGTSMLTSLVGTDYGSYVCKIGNIKILNLNMKITANGIIIQNFVGDYKPKIEQQVILSFWHTFNNTTNGYLVCSTNGTFTVKNADSSLYKSYDIKQCIPYY